MDALNAAGLTENEASIYTTLLEISEGNVTEIAKRTGIHRRNVYDILQRLANKGLVSYIAVEGVKKYVANNPQRLIELVEEKKKMISEEMPKLHQMFSQNAERKSTQFLIGKNGIRYVLDEQLRMKKEILVLGGSYEAEEMMKFYFPKFHNMRKERKIRMRMIYSGKSQLKKQNLPIFDFKKMPEGKGGDIAVNIYGDNTALIMWNEKNPFAILIHEKAVADNFKDYFEFIWSKL